MRAVLEHARGNRAPCILSRSTIVDAVVSTRLVFFSLLWDASVTVGVVRVEVTKKNPSTSSSEGKVYREIKKIHLPTPARIIIKSARSAVCEEYR